MMQSLKKKDQYYFIEHCGRHVNITDRSTSV